MKLVARKDKMFTFEKFFVDSYSAQKHLFNYTVPKLLKLKHWLKNGKENKN